MRQIKFIDFREKVNTKYELLKNNTQNMSAHRAVLNREPFVTRNPELGISTNGEDPDEMLHNAAFRQGLHCLPRQNLSSEKEIQYFLEIITCNPLIYTMDHPDLIVCSFMENSIGP